MPRSRPHYPPEFKHELVELARSGRSFGSLSREFGPDPQTIQSWVKQADLDEGRRTDGLTTAERQDLVRLRRENRTLRMEREILKKAAAWFAKESDSSPKRDTDS